MNILIKIRDYNRIFGQISSSILILMVFFSANIGHATDQLCTIPGEIPAISPPFSNLANIPNYLTNIAVVRSIGDRCKKPKNQLLYSKVAQKLREITERQNEIKRMKPETKAEKATLEKELDDLYDRADKMIDLFNNLHLDKRKILEMNPKLVDSEKDLPNTIDLLQCYHCSDLNRKIAKAIMSEEDFQQVLTSTDDPFKINREYRDIVTKKLLKKKENAPEFRNQLAKILGADQENIDDHSGLYFFEQVCLKEFTRGTPLALKENLIPLVPPIAPSSKTISKPDPLIITTIFDSPTPSSTPTSTPGIITKIQTAPIPSSTPTFTPGIITKIPKNDPTIIKGKKGVNRCMNSSEIQTQYRRISNLLDNKEKNKDEIQKWKEVFSLDSIINLKSIEDLLKDDSDKKLESNQLEEIRKHLWHCLNCNEIAEKRKQIEGSNQYDQFLEVTYSPEGKKVIEAMCTDKNQVDPKPAIITTLPSATPTATPNQPPILITTLPSATPTATPNQPPILITTLPSATPTATPNQPPILITTLPLATPTATPNQQPIILTTIPSATQTPTATPTIGPTPPAPKVTPNAGKKRPKPLPGPVMGGGRLGGYTGTRPIGERFHNLNNGLVEKPEKKKRRSGGFGAMYISPSVYIPFPRFPATQMGFSVR